MKPARLLALAIGLIGVLAAPLVAQAPRGFDHAKHAKVFPRCETCHVGAARPDASIWPAVQSCEACHDGTVAKRVEWTPRAEPPPGNLRFDHQVHRREATRASTRSGADPPTCVSCHQPNGSGWMTTQRTIVGQCLDCHRLPSEHFTAPDTACGTCHLPLAQASRLTEARIKAFKAPPSHQQPSFLAAGRSGHGAQARSSAGAPVAASCATCHARDFCITCHVNAPETQLIQALAPDRRSLAMTAKLTAPGSHTDASFLRRHGDKIGSKAERCATCHTQESCLACHQGRVAGPMRSLAAAGPGRGIGAVVTRKKPATHAANFGETHAPLATAASQSCATCHVQSMCLECHRPDPARASGYHPTGFLSRHPAAAYARETSCADCHNPQQFCVSCHAQTGRAANRPLGTGSYHDAKRFFLFGHGQAARQGLESCVSCHVERDCLTCHASLGGRRFNPHGPGFDPNRLRRKNPVTCSACHGRDIPSR